MFKKKIFIDGSSGTTGLRIRERLSERNDIELFSLPEEKKKIPEERRKSIFNSDITFLCLPDDAAVESVEISKGSSAVIIDTSTAHRTSPDFAYGFPELSDSFNEKIKTSQYISVPGCHASGFISLVFPLIESKVISSDSLLSCFSLTGYSGGGKKMISEYEADEKPETYFAPRQYGLTQSHKHLKEMKYITGLSVAPCFSPVVDDFYSGMQVTVPLFSSQLNSGFTVSDIISVYKSKYSGSVVSYSDSSENGFLSSSLLSGKDSMKISVYGNDDRILLTSLYDNLGKGASGAAIECMNISLGLEPTVGLNL